MKDWETQFYEIFYEPEHQEGGMCWCGITYSKEEDGKLHINHIEQREVIKSFIESTLSHQKEELKEKIKKMKKSESREVRKSGNWDLAIGYNEALEDIISLIEEK